MFNEDCHTKFYMTINNEVSFNWIDILARWLWLFHCSETVIYYTETVHNLYSQPRRSIWVELAFDTTKWSSVWINGD